MFSDRLLMNAMIKNELMMLLFSLITTFSPLSRLEKNKPGEPFHSADAD